MRALRDLPATVPNLSRARRGDGLAARPYLPDAGGCRGQGGPYRNVPAAHRSLSRLPGVRDRVPVWGQVRIAPRGDARPAAPARTAAEASTARRLRVRRISGARAARGRALGVQALPALRASSPRARDRRPAHLPAARRYGCAP